MGNKKFSSKMLISSLCVLAIIATVVGCQIYDSQENTVLYSAMNAQGEGAMSKESFVSDFNKKCKKLTGDPAKKKDVDVSSDAAKAAYTDIMNVFYSFDEFYTLAKEKAGDAGFSSGVFTKDVTNDKHNVEHVKKFYNENCMPISTLRDLLEADETSDAEYEKVKVEGLSVSGMYEKQYQLKWDWNSKKGR